MFIEFTQQDGTVILLNKAHIVSIELPKPLTGIQGSGQRLLLHCLEGRVFNLDPKVITIEALRAQLEPQEVTTNVGRDQGSPVR